MKKCFAVILLFSSLCCTAQDSVDGVQRQSAAANFTARKWAVGGLSAAAYGGSFAFLSAAWYNEYPRRSFHVFNDAGEWKQVDKIGHAWTAYQTARAGHALWRWAGVPDKKALLLGAGSSALYLLAIEYLDGHSAEWGWSWADVGANFSGTALYVAQQLGWKQQRISFKFSAHLRQYNDPVLKQRADHLYGRSLPERLLKDYNSQTYWLSANLSSFVPQTKLPRWLNLAVGYGADGMFGGYENLGRNRTTGAITFDRRDLRRYRQWYLAPDIDFTRIRTNRKFLRTLFSALNVLKMPAPALEYSKGRFRVNLLSF